MACTFGPSSARPQADLSGWVELPNPGGALQGLDRESKKVPHSSYTLRRLILPILSGQAGQPPSSPVPTPKSRIALPHTTASITRELPMSWAAPWRAKGISQKNGGLTRWHLSTLFSFSTCCAATSDNRSSRYPQQASCRRRWASPSGTSRLVWPLPRLNPIKGETLFGQEETDLALWVSPIVEHAGRTQATRRDIQDLCLHTGDVGIEVLLTDWLSAD